MHSNIIFVDSFSVFFPVCFLCKMLELVNNRLGLPCPQSYLYPLETLCLSNF